VEAKRKEKRMEKKIATAPSASWEGGTEGDSSAAEFIL
jgi:hypothetical protein